MSKYSEALSQFGEDFDMGDLVEWFVDNRDTVKQALRIVGRLERGDVSENMAREGLELSDFGNLDLVEEELGAVFKHMAAELLKEEENK